MASRPLSPPSSPAGALGFLGTPAKPDEPAGYAALFKDLGISGYTPQSQTHIAPFAYSGRNAEPEIDLFGRTRSILPGRTAIDRSPGGQVLFALKHDGVDLEALRRVFAVLDPRELERAVREQPAAAAARRAWFAYEWMTGRTLDVPLPNKLTHVPLLDPERYVTCEQARSRRHGVIVNCLGTPTLCPTIRRTPEFTAQAARRPFEQLDRLVTAIDPSMAKRINSYLMTRESQGSYAIEGVTSDSTKDETFFALLNHISRKPRPDINAEMLHDYQNRLIEGRDRELSGSYRKEQVWIGTRKGSMPLPDYIAPKPEDVPGYMQAFCAIANWSCDQANAGALDPIAAGALNSATFVYIHPFMDGNGRLSRLLLQQAMTRDADAAGRRLFIPISAAINRRRDDYYRSLDIWSSQVMRSIRYDDNGAGGITATSDTKDLYRYPDLTKHTEFIYQAANEAVAKDIPEEQRVLQAHDRAMPVMESLGIPPERRKRLFDAFAANGWKLSKNKRAKFSELTDDQVASLELALATPHEPA